MDIYLKYRYENRLFLQKCFCPTLYLIKYYMPFAERQWELLATLT